MQVMLKTLDSYRGIMSTAHSDYSYNASCCSLTRNTLQREVWAPSSLCKVLGPIQD